MKPKKSLGQHFLHSREALDAMIDASDPNALDVILEIGPGKGALTEKLLHFAGKVVAVEKDRELVTLLQEKFAREIKTGKLDLIEGDILDIDPETLRFYKDHNYKIIANIPYNITGAIFKKFLSASYIPELMVVLIQKEVATRIMARDGKESILSLSIKAYGEPHIAKQVPRASFFPPPNVDSAILSIENISKDFFNKFSEETFFTLIRAGFAHKRKLLIRNLEDVYPREKLSLAFTKLNISEKIRAEDLTLAEWKRIATFLKTT